MTPPPPPPPPPRPARPIRGTPAIEHDDHDHHHNGDADAPRARVILVGRTGLDAALRLDPAIDLRRAKTTIEAIGELAEPDDDAAADPVAVVVAPDADPGPRAEDFIHGLRLINPDVRVLLAAGAARPPYHGAISPERPAQQIRAALRPSRPLPSQPKNAAATSPAPPPPAAPAPQTKSSPPPPPPMPAPPRPQPEAAPETPRPRTPAPAIEDDALPPLLPAAPEQDEVSLLEAALTGRDMLLPAMTILRRRAGSPDLVFLPAGDATAAPALGSRSPDGHQVPVVYRERTFGWLSCKRTPAAAVEPHAPWLARWLALREQQEQLRRAAFMDDLTSAYNRRYFDRFLGAAIETARADRLPVTVLVFDIDDFKQYNDRYGHGAGDDILRETVRLLTSVIRPTDRVCRIGGDEFAVIFQDPEGPRDPRSKPPATVREIAQRFQRQICEHRFPKLAEQAPGTLTISGGLATFPWDGDTPEKLLERADELAFQSKRQGKNAITLGPGAERACL